ncbi:DUF1294 domain-containing protein [Ideonella sp. A 288]|uniref:DUF1294 domain-containing protein n=1 Tax=Ideonella sp. A 288 TaxID=1962181 RepID=UPI001F228B4A|nr:DUF1294 domain-containing protein [Ideonella sp. A 288]
MQLQSRPREAIRYEGTLASWNDERGFGFIQPDQGDQRIFIHIKSFSPRHGRPALNQRLSFEVEPGPQGRKHACCVEPAPVARPRALPRRQASRRSSEHSSAQWGTATLFAIPAFVVVALVLSVLWRLPATAAGLYLVASAITLAFYASDKAAARRGGWRVPEQTLHLLALAGGWPGALVAQQVFRHKTTKASFRAVFWGTVIVNVAGLVFLASPAGRRFLSGWLPA